MVMHELEKCMPEITELKSEVKIGTAKDNEILHARKQGIMRGICQRKEIKIQALTVKVKMILTYEDAVKDKEWKEAIEKELKSHTKLNTWTEAELSEGKPAIQIRWVFRTEENGTKEACVVQKDFG
ncbi:hypothetical protein JTB14_028008 [Gonioctena quinquepunctata]|nr:hypothetical protein JTB14_028008 [Gonioctena quinquepunctata]